MIFIMSRFFCAKNLLSVSCLYGGYKSYRYLRNPEEIHNMTQKYLGLGDLPEDIIQRRNTKLYKGVFVCGLFTMYTSLFPFIALGTLYDKLILLKDF